MGGRRVRVRGSKGLSSRAEVREKVRGEYRFSSLIMMKQKLKGKNCAVFCFRVAGLGGKRKIFIIL